MTADQWRKVWQVYDKAGSVSQENLQDFLNSECEDPLVAAKVREMRNRSRVSQVETPAETQDSSQTGLRLHHYLIQQRLGSGGSGEVYLAHDTVLDRKVAVKFLFRRRLESEVAIDRFFQEAKSSSALNHPNIVTIFDFIREDGLGAIAMEYIHGKTLRNAFRGPVSVKEVARIGVQIARGLEAAHSNGIVHRDVKPENIMLRSDGYIKVLDFGLAIPDRSQMPARPHEQPAGTFVYMSPEQLAGDPVHTASDIYSLGLVFVELLSGSPIHPQNTAAFLETIEERRAPTVRLKGIVNKSHALGALLRAMLDPVPEARPTPRK
jgi:serine/threonine protein kinase